MILQQHVLLLCSTVNILYSCLSIGIGPLLVLLISGFTSPFDATVVKLLREAGVDIVGKTNCDEFGMGYVFLFQLVKRVTSN